MLIFTRHENGRALLPSLACLWTAIPCVALRNLVESTGIEPLTNAVKESFVMEIHFIILGKIDA